MSSKETVAEVLLKLSELMSQINEHIKPLVTQPMEHLFEKLDSTDKTKLLAGLAFSLEAYVHRTL